MTDTNTKFVLSTGYLPLTIAQIATPGTPVYVADVGAIGGANFDELWLDFHNKGDVSVTVTVEWGDASHVYVFTLAPKLPPATLFKSKPICTPGTVKIFASVANVVVVGGYAFQNRFS